MFKVEPINASRCLDLVKGNDVHGLNEVLEGDDLLLEVVHWHFVVFDDASDLQLFDSVTERNVEINSCPTNEYLPDGDEFSGTPEKTVHFDRSDAFFHLVEWGLVVPRLDVEDDVRFGNNFSFLLFFGGFSCIVCGDSLGLEC